MDEEGAEVRPGYYDVYEIILNDDGTLIRVLSDIETEPVLKERVEEWRCGRGADVKITVKDKQDGSSISFNCSDVVDWQFGQIAHLDHNLTYIHTHMIDMINEDDVPALFYLVDQRKVLATVEW